MRRHAAVFALVLLSAGCSNDQSADPTGASTTSSVVAANTNGVATTIDPTIGAPTTLVTMQSSQFPDRPYEVFVPSSYDESTPAPLVISLHGFTASGALEDQYIKLQPQAEERGFLYIHPDGETSAQGYEFWNATEGCCAGDQSVDDSGYLTSIIDQVSATYNVDQSRIYMVGYSNGGFMSYRMACDHADRIAAIVSLGGATFLDPTECAPSEPVSILEVHGTLDQTIEYGGGNTLFGPYPGVGTTFHTWAQYNGCGTESRTRDAIDIDSEIVGSETSPSEYLNCPADGAVELWTIEGGSHSPSLASTFPAGIVDWLFAHPKATAAVSTTVDPQAFADRPYEVFVPSGYNASTAAPLVILLHGYGVSGAIQELYFKLQPQAEARGFLYVHPDGAANSLGTSSWNATNACCQNIPSVDDSSYLTYIIDSVSATYNVDPTRIYMVGHSNGGFMSYRMACDHADRIAAIVSLAGATFLDTAQCTPSEPVSILQIHGTADGTIKYPGGNTPLGSYPGAQESAADWSTYNSCANTTEALGAIDLVSVLDGDETTKQAYDGCPVDGNVELWTIADGPHIPQLTEEFAGDIVDWLYAHPKT